MNFDFTNYTFSGILSILAALYGVAYPLILQGIEKLYTQYNSEVLAKKFIHESIYSLFQTLIYVNLGIAVIAPFLLQLGLWDQVVITVQVIMLVLLVVQTYQLYQLILEYSSPSSLLNRLSMIEDGYVEGALSIAEYADTRRTWKLYMEAMVRVASSITHQQDKQELQDLNIPVVYDAPFVLLADRMRHYICKHDHFNYLGSNAELINSLYNPTSGSRISLETHRMVWSWVLTAIENNNRRWFLSYWQYADSYSSMVLRFSNKGDVRGKDKPLFQARHTMIGALLIYHKRYDLFNEICLYTNSLPEYYGLIPSTFAEIVYMREQLVSLTEFRNFICQQFVFHSGNDKGVNADSFVMKQTNVYLSLLIIRLWTLNERYIDFREKLFEIPLAPKLIHENQQNISVFKTLKTYVHKWYENNVFELVPNLTFVEEANVQQLLDEYIKVNELAIESNTNHPVVSESKFAELKQGLISASESFLDGLPVLANAIQNENAIIQEITTHNTLQTVYYSDNQQIDVHTLPEAMFAELRHKADIAYVRIINEMQKAWRTKVPYSQLLSFFDQLNISDSYTVVSLYSDKLFDTYFKPERQICLQHFLPNVFYILPNEIVPTIKITQSNNGHTGHQPLTTNSPISTNLEQFLDCRTPMFELELSTNLEVMSKGSGKKIIEVFVDCDWRTQEEKVELTKTIDQILNN